MKTVVIIPARAASSRFPNKPLCNIKGKPMIWWVYRNAVNAIGENDVYVATESMEIYDVCISLSMNCIMTSDEHPTGTDRACEVANKIPADIYIVLMGDEPLILPKHIIKLREVVESDIGIDAAMLCTKYKNPVDVVNPTTIKLAINNEWRLIYISRALIPYPKSSLDYFFYKNMGCYAFRSNTLDFYKNTALGCIEKVEDIELLRLIENGKHVKCVNVDSESFSIDTQSDLNKLNLSE